MKPGHDGPLQASQEYFAQKTVIFRAQNHCLVEVQHVVIRVKGAIIHGKRRYDKAARRLITQDVLT